MLLNFKRRVLGATGQVSDQFVYAGGASSQNAASYQALDLSDGGHHLVAAPAQSAEVTAFSKLLYYW